MRALLLHDTAPDDDAAAVLEAAGYEVVRCASSSDRSGFSCEGVLGTCPLDATVDVAIVVHERASDDIHVDEAGVVCALRDGLPLVLAGSGAKSPFTECADAVAWTVEQIPGACEAAVGASLSRAAAAIGSAAGEDVSIQRRGDAIRITLRPEATEKAAVLAHQAAHHRFPKARTIDVQRAS